MTMLRTWAAALMVSLVPLAAGAQQLRPFEPASLEQIVASHKGKPFVLLVWSMDCEFCQATLDVIARVRAADPRLEVVTVTTDPVTDQVLNAQVRNRLGAINLMGKAWSFGRASPERLRFALDPAWRGEKPRTYWYDASGKRSAYSGTVQPHRLVQWMQTQLPPGGSAGPAKHSPATD